MAGEIVRELRNCVNEIIILIEQRNFCDEDLLQFRLDWLYNAMVRYVDQIPSGVAIVNLVREASALLLENGGNDIRNFAFKPELSYTGRPGRPTYLVSTEQIEFLIDMRFSSSEIASLFGISDSTVKRCIRESELYVRRRYSDISDESLDDLVRQLMVDFPNCGYKRMTGLLLNAGHRIQQKRIRECMRRVCPEGVLLRALELRAIRRRKYQVCGPLALWHVDGNHKLIR